MNDDGKNEKGESSNGAPEYKVGNKKPPKDKQFKKGTSGNPAGRPKGTKNFSMLVLAELKSTITIHEAGKPKTVTKQQAMAKQLVNKGLNGDPKALDKVLAICAEVEANEKKIQEEPQEICWDEEKEKLFQEIQRHEAEARKNFEQAR